MSTTEGSEQPKESRQEEQSDILSRALKNVGIVMCAEDQWKVVEVMLKFSNAVTTDLNNELQSLRDQLAAKEKECQELSEIISVLPKEEIRILTLDNKAKDKEIAELRDQLSEKESELTHWKGGYEAAMNTIKEMEEKIKLLDSSENTQ